MNPQNKIDKISHGNNEIIVNWELDLISKTKLLDFLKTRTKQEKDLILVISKHEIADLKSALSTEPDSIKEFLETQEKETITSSEIMQWSTVEKNIWWAEKLKVFLEIWDEASYRYFFEWEAAIFKWLNISEDAKRNFSVWANFFIINYLNTKFENANLSWDIWSIATELLWTKSDKWLLEDIPSILSKWENLYSTIEKKWDFLSEISFSDIWKTFDSFFGSEKLKILSETIRELELDENWEKNWVFMNPLESHEFMDYIFKSKNITKENIKEYIKSKNNKNIDFQEYDKVALKNIWDKLTNFVTPEMWGILWKALSVKQFYEKSKDSIKDSIISNKTALSILWFLREMPWIWKFVDMFLEFLWISDINDLLSGKNFEASKKSIKINIIKEWSLFEWSKLDENFMKNNSWNNDNTFLDNINYIIWEKEWSDFWKSIKTLFKKDWDFIKFYNKIKIDQWLWSLTSSDKINYNELSKSINLYKNYKIKLEKTPSLTTQDFIAQFKESESKIKKEEIERIGIIKDKTKEIPPITAWDKFEIWNSNIEYIFENNWTKYKVNLSGNGTLFITWWKKIVQFSWTEDIFKWIVKFKWKLEKKAKASDFWKDQFWINPELDWLTIKEILLNWINSSFLWQEVSEKWLKDQIINNFLNNKWLKNSDTIIVFNEKAINLKLINSNGFEKRVKTDKNQKIINIPSNLDKTQIDKKEVLSKTKLIITEWDNEYQIYFWWNNQKWLIVHINSKIYKLDITYNIDIISEYPDFKVEDINWTFFLTSPWIKEKIKIDNLIDSLKSNDTFILKDNFLQDLILEKA